MVKSLLKKVNEAVDPVAKQKAIRELKDDLGKRNSDVCNLEYGTKQEDASEFLIPLFEELYRDNPLLETSEISPIAEADRKKYKSKSPKSDSKYTIELEIAKGKSSISNLLENFQAVERLSDSESPKYVEGSGIEGQSESGKHSLKSSKKLSLSVKEETKEIVVSTKRFKQDNYGARSKIHDAINLDDVELDIVGRKNKKAKLKPTAFIVHSGEFDGGHYLAYVQEVDKKGEVGWYEYDDDKVRKISENEKCIPRQVLGKSVCSVMGLNPEGPVSYLELRKKQAYVVKYSKINEQGEVDLPQKNRVGAVNVGNTCWANSAAAFAGSFTSFGVAKSKTVVPLDSLINQADPKKPTPKKQVHFASKDDVREFNKLDPIIPDQERISHQRQDTSVIKQQEVELKVKTKTEQPLQQEDNKTVRVGNTLLQMRNLSLAIEPRAIDIQGKWGFANLVTMGFDKSNAEERVKKLNDNGIKAFVKWNQSNPEDYGVQVLIPTKQYQAEKQALITDNPRVVDRKHGKKQNQKKQPTREEQIETIFIKTLKKIKEADSEKNAWDIMTLVQKKVLIYYYNNDHKDNEIKLSSLYKKVNSEEEFDFRGPSGNCYAFKEEKKKDMEKIIDNAIKYIPKDKITGQTLKQFRGFGREKGYISH